MGSLRFNQSGATRGWLFVSLSISVVWMLFLVRAAEAAPQNNVAFQKDVASRDSFSELEKIKKTGGRVSALIVDLESGKTLASLDEDSVLTPASVTKILLAAAALDKFGPNHTFETKLMIENGARKGSKIEGDLVILGGGDPSLTNEYLWRLATDVSRLGIQEVTGSLILETGLFAPIILDSNRLAGQSGSTNAYDSPLSAGAVNFSVLGVFISPGEKVGTRAVVDLEPYALDSVTLVNRAVTAARGAKTSLEVSRSSIGAKDVYTVTGQIAQNAPPQTIYRSVSDPDRYALDVFAAFLEKSGVQVGSKKVRKSKGAPSFSANRESGLIALQSQPLEWQLRGLLRYSNNFIADMLTIQMARFAKKETTIKDGLGLEHGNAVLESYIADLAPRSTKGLRLDSGSGLTPENRLSAAQIVAVLENVYSKNEVFADLFASLPAAGKDGTLKDRFKGPESKWLAGRLRGKTGTLTEPVLAIGLAGYCRTRTGRFTAFSLVVNSSSKIAPSAALGVHAVRQAMEKDLTSILGKN